MSAFPAFFYLCLLGLAVQTRSLIFFPFIKPFLYTCFSGWAVLVVFDSPRAGAFDRVTRRQRDGTGRERAGGRYFREPASLVVRLRPRIKVPFRYIIFPLYS